MPKTLLIVDDEGAILRSLKRILRRQSWTILLAESGEEALDVLAKNDVQVILTDFRMPNMTGGELLSRVNVLYPEIVGLLLSGFAEFNAVVDAFDKSFIYKFLTKPWDETELINELHQAFQVQSLKASEMDLCSIGAGDRETSIDDLSWMVDRSAFVKSFRPESETLQHLLLLDFSNYRLLQTRLKLDSFSFIRHLAKLIDSSVPNGLRTCHWGGTTFLISVSDERMIDLDEVAAELYQRFSAEGVNLNVGVSQQASGERFAEVYLRVRDSLMGDAPYTDKDRLESNLLHAFDTQRLNLVFQPIVNAQTNRVVAIEALIRWRDPELEHCSSLEVVASLCRLGFAEALTSWVTVTAAKVHASLRQHTVFDGHLVINLSLWQLESSSLLETLQAAIEPEGLSFDQLRIDLSEDSILNTQVHCIDNINELNRLGSELSLDDLGTAYGLLANGHKLPLSIVKIDRSFVKDLVSHSNLQEMLLHMSDLISGCGLKIGFEGVETAEQFEFIKSRMAFEYQGDLISAPLSHEELIRWIQGRDHE